MGEPDRQLSLFEIQAEIRRQKEELKNWRVRLISRTFQLVRDRHITSAEAGEIIMEGFLNGPGVVPDLAGAV